MRVDTAVYSVQGVMRLQTKEAAQKALDEFVASAQKRKAPLHINPKVYVQWGMHMLW